MGKHGFPEKKGVKKMFTERKKATHWLIVTLLALVFILIPALAPDSVHAANTGPNGWVGTDKQYYLYGEEIKVMGYATEDTNTKDWVGIRRVADGKPVSGSECLYYYEPYAHSGWNQNYISLNTIYNNKSSSDIGGTYTKDSYTALPPGAYTAYLCKANYEIYEQVDFYVYDFQPAAQGNCQTSSTFDIGLGDIPSTAWKSSDDWVGLFACDASGNISDYANPAFWAWYGDLVAGDSDAWATRQFAALNEDVTATGKGYRKNTTFALAYVTDANASAGTIEKSYKVTVSHSYSGQVTTSPTCTAAGVKTYTCSGCGASYTESVAANGHSYGTATYTWSGYTSCTGTRKCTVSGCSGTDSQTVSGSSITNTITKQPTCTATGTRTYTADFTKTGFTDQKKTETIAATGHSWKDATCTVPQTCKNCSTTNGAALGHSYSSKVTTPATCTTNGVRTYTCSRCNHQYTETINAPGHDYETVVTPPTCVAKGYTTHTCTVCGNSYKDKETAATGHNYTSAVTTAATCTADGVKTYTCSKCNDQYTEKINKTGHSLNSVVTEPTCTDQGYTTTTCNKCDYNSVGSYVTATGHDYTWKITTQAECEKAGEKTFTCGNCGDKYTETIAALVHDTNQSIPAVAATCTETGLTEGKQCSKCGKEMVSQQVVGTVPHTEEIIPAVDATCTETGLTEGKKCSVCDTVLVSQNVVDKKAHDYMASTTKEATCTADGIKTYTCKDCDDSYTETIPQTGHTSSGEGTCTQAEVCLNPGCGQVIKEAPGHTEEILSAEAATCTETGLTEGKKCTVCGEVLIEQKIIPATDHPTREQLPAVKATCTTNGLTAGEKCTICLQTTIKQETIQATGHNHVFVKTVAPTCTAQGYDIYVCGNDDCGDEEHRNLVRASGHDWADATCFMPKECKVCHVTEGNKLSHRPIPISKTNPTCTEDGNHAHYQCERCENYFEDADCQKPIAKESTVIKATGHNGLHKAAATATCTAPGNKEYWVCTNEGCNMKFFDSACKNPADEEEILIAKKAHTMTFTPGKDKTCTADGNIPYYTCEVCNNIYTDADGTTGAIQIGETVIKAGHECDYVPEIHPNCVTPGQKHYYQCTECAALFDGDDKTKPIEKAEMIAPLGHIMTEHEGFDADCEKEGRHTYYTCHVCDPDETVLYQDLDGRETFDNEEKLVIAATGHKFVVTDCTAETKCSNPNCEAVVKYDAHQNLEKIPGVAADCENDGLTDGEHCKFCGKTTIEQTVKEALGHEWQDATCEAAKTCSVCGAIEEGSKALGHNMGEGAVTTDPTCTTPGERTYTCANGCGKTHVAPIGVLGHDCKDTITKAATCTEAGELTSKCSRCDYTNTSSIEPTGHVKWDQGVVTKEQSCKETGIKKFTCECGLTKEEPLPLIEHTPGKAATCTSPQICTVCRTELEAAKGHRPGGVPASCTTAQYCKECNLPVTPMLPHNEVVIPGYAATCTETGLTDGRKCKDCGKVTLEQEIINKLVHVEVTIPGKAATCTETGLTDGLKCNVCDEITLEQEIIPMSGSHVPGKAATCTEAQTCLICKKELAPAKGHTEQKVSGIGATCTAGGLTDGIQCATCGHTIKEQEETPALGHKPGEAATCTKAQLCTVCNTVLAKATGHTSKKVDAVAATCTSVGYTEGRVCVICSAVLEGSREIPKLQHKVAKTKTTKATTAKNGSIVKTCACGHVISETTINKIKKIKLSKTSVVYTGKKFSPTLTITDSKGKKLKKGTDYKVSIPKHRKNVGKYMYKVTFMGKYTGVKKVYLTIKPKAPSIKSVKGAKKAVTVKWKKVTKQNAGYEIKFATNKKFTQNKKTVKVKGYKVSSKKVTKLKAKKTYYVKVRSYKTGYVTGVGIKNKKVTLYSNWSTIKVVKTK